MVGDRESDYMGCILTLAHLEQKNGEVLRERAV